MMPIRRSLLALLFLLALPSAFAQQRRLDSLLRVLKTQPTANAQRLHTLTAAAKTCATIDPKRALALSKEAVAVARKLGDEIGIGSALVAQRWCLFYMGEYGLCDSLTLELRGMEPRIHDPCLIGAIEHWILYTEDWTDSVQMKLLRQRMDSAVSAYRKCGDKQLQAEGLFWCGMNNTFNSNAARIEESLRLFRSIGDSAGVGMCLNALCNYSPYAEDPEGTRALMEHALRQFEQDGNAVWTMWMHSQLVWLCTEHTDFVGAVKHGQEGMEIARHLGLAESLASLEANLSEAYRMMGDLRRAVNLARGSLGHATSSDYRVAVMNFLGSLYRDLGEPDSARYYLDRALKENPFRGDELRYAETRGYLAQLMADEGDLKGATALFEQALEVHRKFPNNYRQETVFSLGMGQCLAHATSSELSEMRITPRKATARAISLFERTLELGREHNLLKEQQDALQELAMLYERKGRMDKAFEYQKRYAVMKDSVLNAEKAKAVARLESAQEEAQRMAALRAEQERKDAAAQEKIRTQKFLRNGLTIGVVIVALIAGVFFFQRNRIRKQKDLSEEILYNVLPEEVANEIRRTGGAKSREIDQVSILFTDFKGFTELSARISRQELMDELNACFQAFDGIIGSHGVEKIKTIGDSYMAAAGLKGDASEAAVNTVRAALRMQAFIEARKAERDREGLPAFQMRVGIHTGPVVAGIVGVKKFQYDIWGDTVNTASRMESSGEVGQVNISEATWVLVKGVKEVREGREVPAFTFTARGKVQAKGKGELEMYFVRRSTEKS